MDKNAHTQLGKRKLTPKYIKGVTGRHAEVRSSEKTHNSKTNKHTPRTSDELKRPHTNG